MLERATLIKLNRFTAVTSQIRIARAFKNGRGLNKVLVQKFGQFSISQ